MQQENTETAFASPVDYDSTLWLETNSSLKEFFNLFFIPILNNLPKGFKHRIKKTNKAAAEVIDNVTNHNALEALYKKGEHFSANSFLEKIFRKIWFSMDNSKAVRNRLRFVIRELRNHLQEIANRDREINIISIASGSSRAITETVKNAHYLKNTKIAVTFLDKNPEAIGYSKNLCKEINHSNIKLEWINNTVGNYFKSKPTKKFDVVEMVGLLDYFEDKRVLEIFKNIYNILQEGGVLITANINHNKEERFVTSVIDWPMIYRTPCELASLVHKAGFSYDNIKAFYEPLKIHGLVVAKK
ncbi:MAG: methyltransferase [Candidatus Zambryskibacteria bacterium]|nr:methyltransferase [Candidatus Zambryskibacteria bacterium]